MPDKAGERPCPAESATRPIGRLPHDGSVTLWPCALWPWIPGLGFLDSNSFAFGLANAEEEVELSSARWWRPTGWQDPQLPRVRPTTRPRGV